MNSPETVLYLYGVVPASMALPPLDGIEEGHGVFLVPGENLACAASHVPARDYDRAAMGRSSQEQLGWVTPRAWRHHEVLRRLQLAAGVVPFTFGTLCTSVDQVRTMLRALRDPMTELLARVEGKEEWTLKVQADEQIAAAALEREEPHLLALKREEASLPEGRAYFVRKKRQRATAASLEARLGRLNDDICARLLALGIECIRTGSETAVLVERQRFDQLEAALAVVESEQQVFGVAFELVGPWPPYTFTAATRERPFSVSGGRADA